MWLLVLMTLVNAVLHQQGIQNEYRIGLGIIQIGILEGTMGIAFLYALVAGGGIRSQYPTLRTHPILIWIVAPMFLGGIFGIAGGLLNGNEMKFVLSSSREFLALPICVIIGYRLLGTPRNVRAMGRWMIVAGVLTASALFYSFGEKTEAAAISGSLNTVRGIINHFHADYASVAALTMVFVVMTRVPLWPTVINVLIGIYCYIGYAATLSRVGFLILLLGTASTYLLLPAGERTRKFFRSLVFIPILFFACWGALWVGDQVIGRDFAGKVTKHMESLLPGERSGSDEKAWDSRVGGIMTELGIWLQNPLMGQGFGAGETAFLGGKTARGYVAIKHNGWTSTLAETGIFGFIGLLLLVSSMILVGYRMVHQRTDAASLLMGGVGFFSGVVFFLRCSGTMAVTSRAAIGFGVVCGMLIRAREIQETEVALARQGAYDEVYVDDETGLLVPEHSMELGHFGSYN